MKANHYTASPLRACTRMFVLACVAAFLAVALESPLAAQPADGTVRISSGTLTLGVRTETSGLAISMTDARGIEYAGGTARYDLRLKDGSVVRLAASVAKSNPQRIVVSACSPELELTHDIAVLPGKGGFLESIHIVSTSGRRLDVDDYRFGLRRGLDASGDLRAVAVPFRRQVDGRLCDWSLAEIAAGKAANSDFRNDGAAANTQPMDSARGRLRAEAWILTDGKSGLLIAKYNQDDIELSMLEWETGPTQALVLGGSSFALHGEPESMQQLEPRRLVQLGATYYLPITGDWPAGYERYKQLLDELGHGLTSDYDPPVNWNELFDVGWYHSDAAGLAKHYTREALIGEAEKAAAVGARLLYLDPGWEVCEGTSLWNEARLGTVSSLAAELRDRFNLGLGFRTIGRVYRDEFPRDWYIQRTREAKPYERPFLNQQPPPEPAPDQDDRGARNLARLPEARARASSLLPGYAIHRVEHLNDGWYGNAASWISNGEPSWAQIDLGLAHRIDKVRLGSEHSPHHGDRAATDLRIMVSESDPVAASDWHVVAEHHGVAVRQTKTFTFEPRDARVIRVEILASTGGNARLDEIEIYEADPHAWDALPPRCTIEPQVSEGTRIAFWEVCTQNRAWQEEKLARLERIASEGVQFMMFDEFDWRAPCYSPHHGHSVPSTPEGHVRAVYGLISELKRRVPGILVEAHDPVWPWGVRYLPVYFDQTLDPARRPGSYEENWGFEFMWRPIDDLLSGRALSLYDYNLACDIPLYDHITAEYDNDACLAFWWYASTVRHLGIGGKKGLDSKEANVSRWQAYVGAMKRYSRLRDWFVRGQFIGIDEWTHLHVLPDKPGGVLVAFNVDEKLVERTVMLDAADLHLDQGVPSIQGACLTRAGDRLELVVSIQPKSPTIIEIGLPAHTRSE